MKQKILIAEDNKTNRKILNRIFCEEYDIFQAENGQEAIELLNACENDIDILLLDLNMPQKNGYEVLAEMRSVAAFRDLPVIVITGEKDKDLEESLQNFGAWAVIRKPFDVKFLRKCVIEALQSGPQEKSETSESDKIVLSNEQLNLIFGKLPYGIGVYAEAEGKNLLYKNDKFSEILGLSDKKVTEEVSLLAMVFNESREIVARAMQNALHPKDGAQTKLQFPIINMLREALWIDVSFSGIQYAKDREKAVLLVVNDITRQKLDAQKDTIIFEQMRYQFEHDQLTGLYNRAGFNAHVSQLLEETPETAYAMICCDISRFHIVNSVWNSEVGDRILASFGNVLQELQSETGAICGRMESDHFGIFISRDKMDLEELQKRSLEDVHPAGINYSVFLKFGVYEVENYDIPPEQMCEYANIALSGAKYDLFNSTVFYNETMKKKIIAEQAIAHEMEIAIEQRQLEIYLQPIHSLSENETHSVEALVRWNHPQRGLLTPDVFIPVLERSGLIIKLDRYVCERTCELLCKRKKEHKRSLPASVNLSRRSIYQSNIAQELDGILKKYGLEADMLSFEITETAYTENPKQLSDTIKALQKLGFKVVMDDFGSGYSSLNMLKQVPVDVLKIDMKFLEGFEHTARAGSIVAAIMRMAHWLDIPVIAEGVETEEQVEFLYGIGCDWIQGFYYAEPMQPDRLEDYLETLHERSAEKDIEARTFDSKAFLGGDRAVNIMIEGVDYGVSIIELHGDNLEIIRANKAYFELFGYSSNAFASMSRNVWQRMELKEREKERKAFLAAMESGKKQKLVFQDYHADGHLLWLESTICYLGGSKRNAAFIVSYADISELKKNEAEIARLKKEIAELQR